MSTFRPSSKAVTQQATKALTAERNQALRGGAHMHRRFFIHVDIRGDVVEVVAHAVQQNAEKQQGVGEVLFRTAVNEEPVADGGGNQTQHEIAVGENVVEGQRHGEQERAEEEYQEVFVAQQDQRVQTEHHFEIQLAGTFRRRIRQEKGKHTQQGRAGCGHQQRNIGIRDIAIAQHLRQEPACQTGGDPADSAHHANTREIGFHVIDVGEGNTVGQRNGGHIGKRVGQQQREEGAELGLLCGEVHQNGTCKHQNRQHFLGGKEAVGQRADENRRQDRRNGRTGIGPANLPRGKAAFAQPQPQRHKPRSPDKPFNKHHE
ncbi:hypothetical protein COLO4_03180 [Corchorus olitorius]|uniref:Uncharacterized protein n=1 Tax=Corchorus olitorius TaxID=93759 RepID=A0A1R3KZD3_9ROSI|nr:hypothetical protein COLO4_03180 [Corchorus olitorius]